MATIDNHFQCGENERDKSYRNDEGVNRYVNSWYDWEEKGVVRKDTKGRLTTILNYQSIGREGLNIEAIKKTGITKEIRQNLLVFANTDGLEEREKTYLRELANNFEITNEEVEELLSQPPYKVQLASYQDKVAYLLLAIDLATQDEVISPEEKLHILNQARNIQMDKVMLIFIENLLDSMAKAYESKQELTIKNQEIKTQNEEIKTQQEALEQQHKILNDTHESLRASITYAKIIQEALLPQVDEMKVLLPQHFVLYMPKDVVSGDYYRIKEQNDRILVTVADCTGHGVPWAFMSILGTNGLDDIVREDKNGQLSPGQILDKLRRYVKESLREEKDLTGSKNGMDMALIALDKKNKSLQYAWAYNPLYVIRNHELIEIKATKSPVWAYPHEKEFETKKLDLKKGDMVYMFSDGYGDQFGGEDSKKLNAKRMKEILLTIADESPEEQEKILKKFIEAWRWKEEQTDDITVMGIKI